MKRGFCRLVVVLWLILANCTSESSGSTSLKRNIRSSGRYSSVPEMTETADTVDDPIDGQDMTGRILNAGESPPDLKVEEEVPEISRGRKVAKNPSRHTRFSKVGLLLRLLILLGAINPALRHFSSPSVLVAGTTTDEQHCQGKGKPYELVESITSKFRNILPKLKLEDGIVEYESLFSKKIRKPDSRMNTILLPWHVFLLGLLAHLHLPIHDPWFLDYTGRLTQVIYGSWMLGDIVSTSLLTPSSFKGIWQVSEFMFGKSVGTRVNLKKSHSDGSYLDSRPKVFLTLHEFKWILFNRTRPFSSQFFFDSSSHRSKLILHDDSHFAEAGNDAERSPPISERIYTQRGKPFEAVAILKDLPNSPESVASYSLDMDVVYSMDPKYKGSDIFSNNPGVIAAGRNSDLARAVGIFAYVGNPAILRSDSAGQLLLGHHDDYDTHCKAGYQVQWTQTRHTAITFNYWVVPGSVVASPSKNQNELQQPVDWIIDTGAAHTYLPSAIYAHVLDSIRQIGYEIVHADESMMHPIVKNCREEAPESWPALSLIIGGLRVDIPPRDYVERTIYDDCYLLLFPDKAHQSLGPSVATLASGILSKLVTVFDRINDRVGFCPVSPTN